MDNKKKKKILAGVIIATLLVAVVGLTYALWSYFQIGPNQQLVAGDIYMKYTETSNTINIENAMPSKTYGEDYFEFTIEGKNTYTKPIWYEIVIKWGEEPIGRTTRIPDEFLRFRLTEQLPNGEEQEVIAEGKYENFKEGERIWVNTIKENQKEEIKITYKLYMWISDEMVLGSGDAADGADMDMETWSNDAFASVKVGVNGDFEEKKLPIYLNNEIKKQITSHTTSDFNPTIEDEDGTIYLSGTNDQINFNYVWYSGKLWRITDINADNTIKMITQDAITVINWGANTTYKGSWIYQWLNEDFLDTLENQENIIVQDAKWYATEDGNSTPVKPTGATIDGKVGLLNAYEYYQSYKNTNYSNGYLNIGYNWWLITPYNSSNVRSVRYIGYLYIYSPSSGAFGVRPSVNLKSGIKISGGDGSKEDPYRISGDKEIATVNDKLNSRVSGEYVNFDGKKYRIVGIENDITKLTSVDYVREEVEEGVGAVMTKNFGSASNWATSVSTDSEDTYWSHYLNNTWYNDISETYKNMLVQGTYYLGQYGSNISYKNTICSASNTTKTTKECNKTSSTWNNGYVGLPRVGEMFSGMLGNGYEDTATYIWLITPYSGSSVRHVYSYGNLNYSSPSSTAYGVRPSINLKSDILISGGKGTFESPYDIKCDTCGS